MSKLCKSHSPTTGDEKRNELEGLTHDGICAGRGDSAHDDAQWHSWGPFLTPSSHLEA